MPTTAIVTLFENHYHYGVAALVNSLYRHGFRGSVFAGYRGVLPSWASASTENAGLCWQGGTTLLVADGLQLHFLPLETDYHLTNYKPDFMIRLWNGPAVHAKSMFYFDPDIVVARPWTMYEEWVDCGVALCEDVNSPLPQFHPRRMAWRRYFEKSGIRLCFKDSIYANGGFIGVSLQNRDFLYVWKKVQDTMASVIGGLSRSMFKNASLLEKAGGPFAPFAKTDQDALNAAVEAYTQKVSFVSKDGMGFEPGINLMHHALGMPKPWHWKPISQAIAGRPPRQVDRYYWKSINGPIMLTSGLIIQQRTIALNIAAAIGRFYMRR